MKMLNEKRSLSFAEKLQMFYVEALHIAHSALTKEASTSAVALVMLEFLVESAKKYNKHHSFSFFKPTPNSTPEENHKNDFKNHF